MMKYRAISILSVLVLCGCAMNAERYMTLAKNEDALRALGAKPVNVGKFESAEPGLKSIMCRAVGPIATEDDAPFADYIRSALIEDLKRGGGFSASAPVTLTGKLDKIDFTSGKKMIFQSYRAALWTIHLTLNSTNGKSMTRVINHEFPSSFGAETACRETARALMPAVQALISEVVQSPEFRLLTH